MLPIVGLLALAVVVVILLLRFMRPRHAPDVRRVPPATTANPVPPAPGALSKEDEEYLDSSHILPAGQGPLDTRADDWRNDKRK